MYCPRCSQQQGSAEMRYCSRCGFPLEGVSALLAGGGQIAGRGAVEEDALTPRQRGMRKGLMMTVGGLLFFGIAFVMTVAVKEDLFVLMLPAALLVVAGVMRLLYGLLLESDAHRRKQLDRPSAPDASTRELSPAKGTPLPPASVADSTTRLLAEREPTPAKRK